MYRQACLRKLLQRWSPSGPMRVRKVEVSDHNSSVFSQSFLELHLAFNHHCHGLSPISCKGFSGTARFVPERKSGIKEKLAKMKTIYRHDLPWNVARCTVHTSSSDLAGHSKWSKVKYIKGPKDHERSVITSKIVSQMKVIMKEGGSNPDTNPELANLILFAKSKGIPKTTIETFIKNAAKSKDRGGSQYICEVQGPKGSALIVEYMTDHKKRSRDDLLLIVKKHGCTVGALGSVMYSFKRKGILELKEGDDEQPLTLDLAMELAIEVGAEDVVEEEDEEEGGRVIFKIICDQADFRDVREALRNTRHSSGLEFLEYLPESMVSLSDTELDKMGLLIAKLEEHPDVLNVSDNITDER